MSKGLRWLFIVLLGLNLHMFLVIFAMLTLSPNRNLGLTAMVIPFGQLNYQQATSVATIEWLLIFVAWIVFAVLFLRQPSDR